MAQIVLDLDESTAAAILNVVVSRKRLLLRRAELTHRIDELKAEYGAIGKQLADLTKLSSDLGMSD